MIWFFSKSTFIKGISLFKLFIGSNQLHYKAIKYLKKYNELKTNKL